MLRRAELRARGCGVGEEKWKPASFGRDETVSRACWMLCKERLYDSRLRAQHMQSEGARGSSEGGGGER